MASFNKITIIGYLGKDPETRYLPDSTAVCSFSIATTEKSKRGGESHETTTWFKVTCWGKLAEIVAEYLTKGSQAYVEGRLSQTEYTDRDGNKRTSLEVRADTVQFLDRKGETQQSQQARPSASKPKAQHQEQGFGADDPEDLPF